MLYLKTKHLKIEMPKDMRRSKLRRYEDILCSLYNKAKTIDEIAYSTNMACNYLRLRIEFLFKNGLIEEIKHQNATLYALTSRGLAIHKTITITNRLKKLQTNIQKIDKTLKTIHIFSGNELDKVSQKK